MNVMWVVEMFSSTRDGNGKLTREWMPTTGANHNKMLALDLLEEWRERCKSRKFRLRRYTSRSK